MRNNSEPAGVRPLRGLARAILTLTTTATIVLFYIFVAVVIVVMLAWLGLFLLVLIALARFGVAGLVTKYFERDTRLLVMLAQSLWLSEGARYQLPLQRQDAPRLFTMLDDLAGKFAIPPPDEMCLEMSGGAWVELRGLKTGLGTTRVGVGYDLLAALSEREVEAVMAHELAHAKLIGRVFHNWLFRGLNRAARLSNQLSATVDSLRRADESVGLAAPILAGTDALTRLGARQLAAYSRQGEFEADRGSADTCGAAAIRSALTRLEQVHSALERLPWNERVARIESPDGLSGWLQTELAGVETAAAAVPEVFDRYSTHPSLADRLAALPDDGSRLPASPSGLGLLAEPDSLAMRLVGAIEKTALSEERKDLRELRRWLRSARRGSGFRLAQVPGGVLALLGFVIGVIALCTAEVRFFGLIMLGTVTPLGVWLFRLGYYRDRRPLPVPDLKTFLHGRDQFPIPDIEEKQKVIEQELQALAAAESRKKRRATRLVDEAYAALANCDYLRAHVATRLAHDLDKNSIERALAQLVAAAAFGQADLVNSLLGFIIGKVGVRSPSTTWAFAWAMMLEKGWMPAESLLHETLRRRSGHPVLLSLLALCQSRRGKLQTSIENMRRVSTLQPLTEQQIQLFAGILLDRGSLHEAAQQLDALNPASAYDPDIAFLRVRLSLLRRDFAAAEKNLAMLDLESLAGHRLLAISRLYEDARADAQSLDFLHRALRKGHYPAGLLGVAQHALRAKDTSKAREYILASLDTTKPAADRADTAFDIFPGALAMLCALKEPVDGCIAWIASFLPGVDAGPLSRNSLVVYGRTQKDAETSLLEIMQAVQPGKPAISPAYMLIKPAPGDMQPARPVRQGVQYIYR